MDPTLRRPFRLALLSSPILQETSNQFNEQRAHSPLGAAYADATSDDVLVAISVNPYSRETIEACQYAARKGLKGKRVNVGNPGSGQRATMEVVIFRFEIADRQGLWSTSDIVMSGIGMVVVLVAVYRALGLPLVVIGLLFLALAFFGGYSEWVGSITNYGGSSFTKAMGHYWMQTEGVFGVALGVSTTMIFLFVLFGALLAKAGGGNWFIKVAISRRGALRGGVKCDTKGWFVGA